MGPHSHTSLCCLPLHQAGSAVTRDVERAVGYNPREGLP